MSEPTLYFPTQVDYKLGLTQGRRWSTKFQGSPSGRTERTKQWIRPKWNTQATVYPSLTRGDIFEVLGRSNNPADPPMMDTDDVWGAKFIPFLNNVAGRFNNFYIFDSKSRLLNEHRSGHWNGGGDPLPLLWPDDLPFSFDFRGPYDGLSNALVATVEYIILVPVGGGPNLNYEPADFTIGSAGMGQETTLIEIVPTISPSPPPTDTEYYHLYVSASNAHQRFAAEMTTDLEQVGFDWAAAEPPTELVLDLEESFG